MDDLFHTDYLIVLLLKNRFEIHMLLHSIIVCVVPYGYKYKLYYF